MWHLYMCCRRLDWLVEAGLAMRLKIVTECCYSGLIQATNAVLIGLTTWTQLDFSSQNLLN